MELTDYARVIWRWLWLIALGVAVALGSTFLAIRDQPPQRAAKAALMVGQAMQQQQPNSGDLGLAQDLARTYADMAMRRPVRESTMEALGLGWLPEYAVNPVPNTQLLEIRVVDTEPQRAVAVANELARQLILQTPANYSPQDMRQREFIQRQIDGWEASIEATLEEMSRLSDALGGMFSAREIADTRSQIAALEQKYNNTYNYYIQSLQYLGTGAVNTLSLIEPAIETYPIGPSKKRTLAMAGAVGLVLAVATAFLLDSLDDTLKTPVDVERSTQLTTLAGISRIPGEQMADRLITVKHPKSPISEAYRSLRTNLQFSSLDRPLRTLIVTSPSPTEGKSTTLANLGVVMAQAGRRVILVDSDLRRPVLHRIFGLENERGLTDVLLDDELSLDGHLKPTGVESLWLLNTGPLPPNPSELLGSARMSALVKRLKEEADVVLFDSPPVLAVTDASVLGAWADGVLLVTDAGQTRRSLAKEAAERLRQVGANLVGATLNRLRPGRGGYYYHYYDYNQDSQRKRRRKGLRRWLGGRNRSSR